MRLLHINPYGAVPMLIRYITAFFATVVVIRFIKKWRGQSRDAKAAKTTHNPILHNTEKIGACAINGYVVL